MGWGVGRLSGRKRRRTWRRECSFLCGIRVECCVGVLLIACTGGFVANALFRIGGIRKPGILRRRRKK